MDIGELVMAEERKAVEVPEQLQLQLNPVGVIHLMMRSLHQTIEVMNIALEAMEKAEVTNEVQTKGSKITFTYKGAKLTEAQAKEARRNWMLSKGFQELARGVRSALEEAYIYSMIVEYGRRGSSAVW